MKFYTVLFVLGGKDVEFGGAKWRRFSHTARRRGSSDAHCRDGWVGMDGFGHVKWEQYVIFYTATELGLSSNVRRVAGRYITLKKLDTCTIVLGEKDDDFGRPL